MRVGEKVYYIRNNEVKCGWMIYNDKGIITIRKPSNRVVRIRISQVADRISEDIRRLK